MNTEALSAVAAQISAKPRAAARPHHLTEDERRSVVETFITLVEGLYAHLPQKRATYGQDPVQRLRLLQQRLAAVDEQEFHGSLAGILTDLRDAHTRYIGPAHVEGDVAFLPPARRTVLRSERRSLRRLEGLRRHRVREELLR